MGKIVIEFIMPAIFKILIVFTLILILSRLKIPLGISLVTGGIVIYFWAKYSIPETFDSLIKALLSLDVWLFSIIIVLLLEIGDYLTRKEVAENLIYEISRLTVKISKSFAIIAIPAVIGLIPMPGGALFSAPLLEISLPHSINHKPHLKAALNYWFRHVWEYWWPLYPGVIVAIKIMEMEPWQFITIQFPFSLVTIIAGYFLLIKKHKIYSVNHSYEDTKKITGNNILYFLSPVFIILISSLFLPAIFKNYITISEPTLVSMIIGILLAILVIYLHGGYKGKIIFNRLISLQRISLILTITGTMIFQHMLKDCGITFTASKEMQAWGINPILLVIFIPFIAGIVTGLGVGFTSTSFPFIISLMHAFPETLSRYATLVLAYGSGYIGMLLSPVHLCLLVTKEYFNSSFSGLYKEIIPCCSVLAFYSILIFFLFYYIKL